MHIPAAYGFNRFLRLQGGADIISPFDARMPAALIAATIPTNTNSIWMTFLAISRGLDRIKIMRQANCAGI